MPELPKSIVASALSPAPAVEITVPRPNFWCVTRSPGESETTGPVPMTRSPSLSAALLLDGDEPQPPELIGVFSGSSRSHCSTSLGISSRNREGGL